MVWFFLSVDVFGFARLFVTIGFLIIYVRWYQLDGCVVVLLEHLGSVAIDWIGFSVRVELFIQ